MHVTHAKVANFRALRDAEIQIDASTTLIVGRNNSGKTSFVNLFEKFFSPSDEVRFVLEDFTTSRIADLEHARRQFADAEQLGAAGDSEAGEALRSKALELVPAIRLTITIDYDEKDDLAPISSAILDLDETCHSVRIVALLAAGDPRKLLTEFGEAARRAGSQFDSYKWLRRKFNEHFTATYRAVSPVDDSVTRELKPSAARSILAVRFIYAQNKFDDTPADKTRTLSKTFEAYYRASSTDDKRGQNVDRIEEALALASKELDANYDELFEPFLDDLSTFGLELMSPLHPPRIVALIEGAAVLRGSTRIQYPSGDAQYPLPEGHNGLGYSKLIFTILQIRGFIESCSQASPQPALQILFIEEPEAHLHPQMQETFIKNIEEYIKSKTGRNVQVVITTHSSHMVARSGFAKIRYFDATEHHISIKDLSTFQANVKKTKDGSETLRFLEQYMELHRCDMFFADKIILIEGTAERLLLPKMIGRCAARLQHQYVSVIEVGDAYAVRFRSLLEFLNVKTLIITDLDSVDPSQKRAGCHPATPGACTSNSTLKKWLPAKEAITDLLAAEGKDKTSKKVRVAYQVPEHPAGPFGRSFEDAFIIANAPVLADNLSNLALKGHFDRTVGEHPGGTVIETHAYEIAESLRDHKTDFAFDAMLLDNWKVPRYIDEGLLWLMLP
ncbi:ATP-dependent endonuclease [Streptomyces sp. NBC_00878]|uniref:ATP-dependent nuclease n=1 Tax=Streptomyces sp. NBC_00878 TaxID=2975854 RepID=UPI0022531328|nr:ATP-dependent endonuclease [Streptomyces sp. NBC_00878]MCX4909604.1 ATP-dependent endonuclease [Streptomyces sp. NBC_00878]